MFVFCVFILFLSFNVESQNIKKDVSLQLVPDKTSYMLGVDAALYFKKLGAEINRDSFILGIEDMLDGNKLRFSDEELLKIKNDFINQLKVQEVDRIKKISEENLKNEEEFLNKNKNNKEVVTLPDGLQYIVIKKGEGKSPLEDDMVKVDYRGSLINGYEFDSSYKRGEPVIFPLNGVIEGWKEILKIMKAGSHYKVFIPSKLGYGERGNGKIGPNETLIFDIELLEILSALDKKNESVKG